MVNLLKSLPTYLCSKFFLSFSPSFSFVLHSISLLINFSPSVTWSFSFSLPLSLVPHSVSPLQLFPICNLISFRSVFSPSFLYRLPTNFCFSSFFHFPSTLSFLFNSTEILVENKTKPFLKKIQRWIYQNLFLLISASTLFSLVFPPFLLFPILSLSFSIFPISNLISHFLSFSLFLSCFSVCLSSVQLFPIINLISIRSVFSSSFLFRLPTHFCFSSSFHFLPTLSFLFNSMETLVESKSKQFWRECKGKSIKISSYLALSILFSIFLSLSLSFCFFLPFFSFHLVPNTNLNKTKQ